MGPNDNNIVKRDYNKRQLTKSWKNVEIFFALLSGRDRVRAAAANDRLKNMLQH